MTDPDERPTTASQGPFASTEGIVDVGRREGWTVVSMHDDWATVFPGEVKG